MRCLNMADTTAKSIGIEANKSRDKTGENIPMVTFIDELLHLSRNLNLSLIVKE